MRTESASSLRPRAGLQARRGGTARIVSVLLVVWLIIGALAAAQRDYFSGAVENCAKTGTILVTIIAGPLNYVGLNPKIESCNVPQPSE